MQKKTKRILAGIFTGVLMILPISALEQRAPICPSCGNFAYPKVRCGGVASEENLRDLGYNVDPTTVNSCTEHGKKNCNVIVYQGLTVRYCPICDVKSVTLHACQEKHTVENVNRNICPYGGLKN